MGVARALAPLGDHIPENVAAACRCQSSSLSFLCQLFCANIVGNTVSFFSDIQLTLFQVLHRKLLTYFYWEIYKEAQVFCIITAKCVNKLQNFCTVLIKKLENYFFHNT